MLFQAGLTAALILIAIRVVDFQAAANAVRQANLWLILPAMLLFTLAKFIDAFRWRYLLQRVGAPPQPALFGAFLIGNMVNNLLPFRVGDVAKIQVLGQRYGTSRAGLAASVFVVEASLDGVTFMLLLAIAILFWDVGALDGVARAPLIGLAVIATAAFLLGVLLSHRLSSMVSHVRWGPIQRVLGSFEAAQEGLHALGHWRRILIAIALSLPAWLVEATMFWTVGNAFGFELGYPAYLAVMIAANLAVAIPVTLWNVGTYQALVMAVLIPSGISEADALGYALTTQLVTSAWIQCTGLAALWAMRIRPRELFQLSRQQQPQGTTP